MLETTLGIIKPDAVRNQYIGKILSHIEEGGLEIAALIMVRLSRQEAEGFYGVHRERPFFGSLTQFMSEGPIVVLALRGEDAIRRWRELMGATNPAEAAEATIRRLYAENIERNSVHGSDSPESAAFELRYFFNGLELALG
ncbi:MAG: nucleoside-diphosphate kinase [Acidobacteriota bacterium]